MTLVSKRLAELLGAGKAVGVLGSPRATNEENYLVGKLARAALGTNNVDFSLRAAYQPMLSGITDVVGELPRLATLEEVEQAELIIVCEGDLARSHSRAASAVASAVARGSKLVTVGPVRTQMSRLASHHFPVVPGSAGEAINGLLAGLLGSKPKGGRALAENLQGFESLRSRVTSLQVSEAATQVGGWLRELERVVLLLAPPPAAPDLARSEVAALVSMMAIAGHLHRPGSGIVPLVGRSNFLGALEMGVDPTGLPGRCTLEDATARQNVLRVWGKQPPEQPGYDANEMVGKVRGLIVVADDPVTILPGEKRTRAALEGLEFLVVLDSYATRSTELAHVVLPIASFAETEGTYTNMEGRVQRVRPVAEPPGGARHGWQVLANLVSRLGATAPYQSAEDVMGEVARVASPYEGVSYAALEECSWRRRPAASVESRMSVRAAETRRASSDDFPFLLVRSDTFDWGTDALVGFSPTLRRDSVSQRKLFPGGLVEMSPHDAAKLGLRAWARAKLTSARGEAVLPVVLREDLDPGVLLLPFAFRDHAAAATGEEAITPVKVGGA